MTGSIISGTVTATVTIGAGGYGSPLTITSSGEVAPAQYDADAIDAPSSLGSVSIANYGRALAASAESGTGQNGGIAMNLLAAAAVDNVGFIYGGGGGFTTGRGGEGGAGVLLAAGGMVTNSGTIRGGSAGGYNSACSASGAGLDLLAGGTVVNSGTIAGGSGLTGTAGGYGVSVVGAATVTNTGTILGGPGGERGFFLRGYTGYEGGAGVVGGAGMTVTNGGTIAGGYGGKAGVGDGGGGGSGAGGVGVSLGSSGVLVNHELIEGGAGGDGGGSPGTGGIGVAVGAGASVSNSGTITGGIGGTNGRYNGGRGGAGGIGVQLNGAGILNNAGVISAGNGGYSSYLGGIGGAGVDMNGGTLTNTGTISGGAGGSAGQTKYVQGIGGNGGAGVYLNGGTLIDAGTISGGAAGIGPGGNGVAGDAVLFGTVASELVVRPHAILNGAIEANASVDDVLILAGRSAGTIAAAVTGFTSVQAQTNAHWTVSTELQAATITLAGGILTDAASGTIFAGTNGKPEAGAILVSQNGTLIGSGNIAAAQIIDDGKLDAHSGTLTVKGSLSGYGTVRIDSNATLVEKGTLSVTHLAFGLNGDAHLAVAKPIPQGPPAPTFYAFGMGDTIDLQNLQANGLNFANGTLTLQDSGMTVDTLLFSGDYSSTNFTLTSDGGGGTVISFVPDEAHLTHLEFLQHW